MSVKLTFLGAAGTVTGSKYLIEGAGKKILVDCGLFQGNRDWNEKNWAEPALDLRQVDALLLTHAHIDHVGILPRYHRLGLKCPVFCTKPTQLLSQLVLLDSAHLQEEEAEYRESRGVSRHHPALPLYTTADAEAVLARFRTVPCEKRIEVVPGVFAEWRRMGHIIGACSIRLEIEGKVINFSGDIGRYHVPILKDPQPVAFGDLLLIESTYGDRDHPSVNPQEELARVINETYARRGLVLIPSFAVGRTQSMLYYLRELKLKKQIPDLPIVIDSPMAMDATSIYRESVGDYDEAALGILKGGKEPFSCPKLRFVRNRSESIQLNSIDEPMVLISASGMLTGGRILHHLRHRVTDPRNTILFVGFQPPGSRGAWIKSKPETVRVFGQELPMRAQVAEISSLSAHADRGEMLRWCKECSGKPTKVAVVHGEPPIAESFAATLRSEMQWDVFVAAYLQTIEL